MRLGPYFLDEYVHHASLRRNPNRLSGLVGSSSLARSNLTEIGECVSGHRRQTEKGLADGKGKSEEHKKGGVVVGVIR